MIDLKGIHKTYPGESPLHVLKGVDLHIDEGELVSIMGASGSGKSTLLNIMGILDTYDEGEYHLAGNLIKDLTNYQESRYRNQLIGFIFQSFNLIDFKNAMENVALPLYYRGVKKKERNELAMEYLASACGYCPCLDFASEDYSCRRAYRCLGFQDHPGGDGHAA